MKINLEYLKLKDIFKGFIDKEEGIWAYEGKLNIRPPYKKAAIYKQEQQEAVINTIFKKYSLGLIHILKNDENSYELLDGQKRIMSIMSYMNNDFSVSSFGGLQNNVSWTFHNLPKDKKNIIENYELMVNIIEKKEQINELINNDNNEKKLTKQEIRNAFYGGKWLSEAQNFFSKTNCPAYQIGNKYFKNKNYLETALKWISDGNIETYMKENQHKNNAHELINYFKNLISWVDKTFIEYRPEMKGINWGEIYNKNKNQKFNAKKLNQEIQTLMNNQYIKNKSNIYKYIFDKNERYLFFKDFDLNDKKIKYQEQKSKCKICRTKCKLEEMKGDYIISCLKEGTNNIDNLQMLCKNCYIEKTSQYIQLKIFN